MKVFTVLLLAILLPMLISCDAETSNEKSGTAPTSMMIDERTPIGELPDILSEGLTPEEKEELMAEILPAGENDGPTAEEKFKAFFEKARTGDPEAQNGLGIMYYTGEAISKNAAGKTLDNDPELAAGWFARSAEQGYADAQFNLGLMYANGEGIEQDIAQAVTLFRKAAEQGNIDAQNNLGALYYTGEGVSRNVDKAIKWFEKAAAQGNVDAQANLDAIRSQQANK